MILKELLLSIQSDSTWGIWAELIDGNFKPESPARFGQRSFANVRLFDGKYYVANGKFINQHHTLWLDYHFVSFAERDNKWCDDFISFINESLNEDKEIKENG